MHRGSIVTLFLAVLSGCGLADYEKRMDEQRERLQAMDKENEVLGDVIQMPSGKDPYGEAIKVPFDIFLRPPQGIAVKIQGPKAIYYGGKLPLYRYTNASKTDVNMFVAAAKIVDATSKEKPKEDELTPDDFRAKVREALLDYFRREHGGWNASLPDFAALKKESLPVTREGKQQALVLETAVADDGRLQNPSRLFIFVHVGKYRQAAVIYQAPVQIAEQGFRSAVEISVKTLEITALAITLRTAYARLR